MTLGGTPNKFDLTYMLNSEHLLTNMVNTFLVVTNYTDSARLLDRKRLPNQRREAYQILCNIQRLKAMSKTPVQVNPYEWYGWIRTAINLYRQESTQRHQDLVRINGQWQWQWQWQWQCQRHDQKLTIPVITDVMTITYGFMYHPAILMWLGYEESLKEYLDAHIAVSIERGIKNTMSRYSVTNTPQPPWTQDPDFLARHRAMLLKKELERHETPWYQLNPLFTAEVGPARYFWPYTPTIGSAAQIQGEADTTRRYKPKFHIGLRLGVVSLPP